MVTYEPRGKYFQNMCHYILRIQSHNVLPEAVYGPGKVKLQIEQG